MFSDLSQQPTLIQVQEAMPTIERFTVLPQHRISNYLNTNECRRELFCQVKSIDNIPPRSTALWKHTLRSCYIAGYVWTQFMIKSKLYQHQRIGDGYSKIISWYFTGLTFPNKLLLKEISPNVTVSQERVVKDDASACNLSYCVCKRQYERE